ncbi:MAG: hypothetical protein OXC71_09475, partial [Chloroflexi bacterium]|nr:hypothetical protein [Chloroflexota bacterium]
HVARHAAEERDRVVGGAFNRFIAIEREVAEETGDHPYVGAAHKYRAPACGLRTEEDPRVLRHPQTFFEEPRRGFLARLAFLADMLVERQERCIVELNRKVLLRHRHASTAWER